MPQLTIDIAALKNNLQLIKKLANGKKVMAMVKANAYGHGLLDVATALPDVDCLAVARFKDAMFLRNNGINKRVVVLSGAQSAQEFALCAQHKIDSVLHDPAQLEFLAASSATEPVQLWVKIDTGMHRLGFSTDDGPAIISELKTNPKVKDHIEVMTHLANADDLQHQLNNVQIKALKALNNPGASLCNSAAMLNFSEVQSDWLRIGLLLYGVSPIAGLDAASLGFKPVMTFSAPAVAIKTLPKGALVGYGSVYTCPETMPVAVLAAGYADGYPREVSADAYCLQTGRKCPVLGRVSMDLLVVDLRTAPNVTVGDNFELWGKNLPVATVAGFAGTIPWVLLSGVSQGCDYYVSN